MRSWIPILLATTIAFTGCNPHEDQSPVERNLAESGLLDPIEANNLSENNDYASPTSGTGVRHENDTQKDKEPSLSHLYSIGGDQRKPPHKRVVTVHLKQRITRDEIRTIAHEIKDADPTYYRRVFILYTLWDGIGEQPIGCWATSHFEPDLKIIINGKTQDEHDRFLEKGREELKNKNVVGSWVDESPVVGGLVTIKKEGTAFCSITIFKDQTILKRRLVEVSSHVGRRFNCPDSRSGDHFIVDRSGDLQIRDRDGLILIARKVD